MLNVNINTTASQVGSLVGFSAQSTIMSSYATGSVTGTGQVGGLVGENSNAGMIADSYAMVNVIGTGNRIGGLVGINFLNSRIINSYAMGAVRGVNRVGGLVGENSFGSTIENSYATGDVMGSGDEVQVA